MPNTVITLLFVAWTVLLSAPVYGSQCGGTRTGARGWVASPNFPNHYDNNENCTWTIRVETGHAIRFKLNWGDLDLEKEYDFLTMVETSPLGKRQVIGSYTGGDVYVPVLTSRTNEVEVTFQSDKTIVGNGFNVTWEKVDVQCGGTIQNGTGGLITFSPYPNGTKEDHACYWVLQVPERHFIRLTFPLGSHVDAIDHFFKIFETSPFGSRIQRGSYTGDTLPRVYTSFSNALEIEYLGIFDKEFNVTWEEIDAQECGEIQTSLNNSLTTPNYPQPVHYDHNPDCDWFIEVPEGKFVRFVFHSPLLIEEMSLLEIVDHGTPWSSMSYKHNDQPRPCTSMTNKVHLKLKSPKHGLMVAFQITWEAVDSRCGGIMPTPSGTEIYPYNDVYGHHTDCRWLITVPKEYNIRIIFHPWVQHRDHDSLSVVDISPLGEWNHLDTPAVQDFASKSVFTSKSNRAAIFYHGDGSGLAKGYNFTWQRLDLLRCGGQVNGSAGSIQTPNFPYHYPSSLDCTWIINVPADKFIKLTFHSPFDIGGSELEILERSRSGEMISRVQYFDDHVDLPPVFTSTSNQVKIDFTAFNEQNNGFNITWEDTDETTCDQIVQVSKTGRSRKHTLDIDQQCLPGRVRQSRCSLTMKARSIWVDASPLCARGSFDILCNATYNANITVRNGTEQMEVTCGHTDQKFCALLGEDLHVTYEGNVLCPTDMIEEIKSFLDIYQSIDDPDGGGGDDDDDDYDDDYYWYHSGYVYSVCAVPFPSGFVFFYYRRRRTARTSEDRRTLTPAINAEEGSIGASPVVPKLETPSYESLFPERGYK